MLMTVNQRVAGSSRVHFGAFWYTRLGKKNAQNLGFEHFDTICYCIYAEREVLEPFLVSP